MIVKKLLHIPKKCRNIYLVESTSFYKKPSLDHGERVRKGMGMDITKRELTKIVREANKLTIRTMRESGIGSGEFDLIHLVRHHPGISQKEISETLNMDKGAVARRVANLEGKGYLTRKANPKDGRSQWIYATDKAETLKNSKETVEAVFYEWLTEELSKEDCEAFSRILDQLYLRSKKESRSGFPHVVERLEKRNG